jgi:hypothetical protein
VDSFHRVLPLPVVDEPLTWAAVHEGVILAVHARGQTSAIGMEMISFVGEARGRVSSVRAEVLGAVFPAPSTALLLTPKRLLVVDLTAKKIIATHAASFQTRRPLATCGSTVLTSPIPPSSSPDIRFERVTAAGIAPIARVKTKNETVIGAFAESESRWWVWSAKRLSCLELAAEAAQVVASWDLPLGVDQMLVDPARDIALAMDTSVGLAGSTACAVRLGDGQVLARAPVPAGRLVWDEEGRGAIVDEKESRIHRVGPALAVHDVIPTPPLVTTRFPVRVLQLSPAELLVHLTPAKGASSLLHLAWGSGVVRAAAR